VPARRGTESLENDELISLSEAAAIAKMHPAHFSCRAGLPAGEKSRAQLGNYSRGSRRVPGGFGKAKPESPQASLDEVGSIGSILLPPGKAAIPDEGGRTMPKRTKLWIGLPVLAMATPCRPLPAALAISAIALIVGLLALFVALVLWAAVGYKLPWNANGPPA
jgi:hypothetical protein